MDSSDTFDDLRKELDEQWKHHTNNLFPLFRKVAQKIYKKSEDYAQKSVQEKSVTRTSTGIRSQNISTGRVLIMQKHKQSRTIWLKMESEDRLGMLKLA